jgi:hypothetical protein
MSRIKQIVAATSAEQPEAAKAQVAGGLPRRSSEHSGERRRVGPRDN